MTSGENAFQQVPARLLIESGWIIGTFHVPVSMNFVEFLDAAGPFFKLTNVTIGHQQEPVEFFALRCDEVSLIIPHEDESKLHLSPGPAPHAVVCWMHSGEIVGTLKMDANLRVSDYLMQHSGFVALYDCSGREKHAPVNASSVIFVNARTIVGVVDRHIL